MEAAAEQSSVPVADRHHCEANLFQDRDWPVLTDYRALIGGMLKRGYGLSQTQLAQVFPQAAPADLALI